MKRMIGVLTAFCLMSSTLCFGLGAEIVHDPTNYQKILDQLTEARKQLDVMKSQMRQMESLTYIMKNPKSTGRGFLGDLANPLTYELNQIQGFKSDLDGFKEPRYYGMPDFNVLSGQSFGTGSVSPSYASSNSFETIKSFEATKTDVRQKFFPKENTNLHSADLKALEQNKRKAQEEAALKATALAWTQQESVSKEMEELQKISHKIGTSQSLYEELVLSNHIHTLELKEMIQIKALLSSLVEIAGSGQLGIQKPLVGIAP